MFIAKFYRMLHFRYQLPIGYRQIATYFIGVFSEAYEPSS